MTTKFDIGQKVYTLFRNRVCLVELLKILITYVPYEIVTKYTFQDPDTANESTYPEHLFFATKEELLKSL